MITKQTYLREKRKLEQRFRAEQRGHDYLQNHSDLIDSLVKSVVETHSKGFGLAVFATGGYGRKELFPFSDLDLLLVFDGEEKQTGEQLVSIILRDLWDTGLDIGHQVWSFQELTRLSLEQDQFVLALLDLRPLVHGEDLGDRVLSELVPSFLKSNREALCARIVELAVSRHQEFEDTVYQLEPDLKLSPGGLRDLQIGKWLSRLTGRSQLPGYSATEIESSEEFLKRLRILVHLLAGRNDNRLTHKMQGRVRKYIGYRAVSAQSGVEALMKEYFLNARISYAFCKAMLKVAASGDQDKGVEKEPGTLKIESMSALLELFLEEGHELSDSTRQSITEALPSLSATLHFPSMREGIKAIFRPRPGLYKTLSQMYELGVLELLFPEFGSIRAQVIWDFYHRYTVDEHTLLAIRNVELLASAGSGEDGRFKTLLQDTVDGSLLTIALLFHDVGKGGAGQHSDKGARMAARAMRRFRFAGEQIDTISFLIQHHLAMSAVIFKRDLEDALVVSRFADLIRDPELLRLLTLLTYADIKAVAPRTLNQWKRDLLWQLYIATHRKLTLGYGEERVEEEGLGDKVFQELGSDVDREKLEKFVEGFPARYLRNTQPAEIYEHYRMAQRLDTGRPVQTRITKDNGYYELCVVTVDKPYLFAKIAGLLSYFEMNILRGHGFSNKQQIILDFFRFIDSGGHFRRIHERTRFQELLDKSILDELSMEKLLQGKEESVLFRRPAPGFEPTVYFEDEHSDRFTILEIVAPDALGLLYRISREISHLGCDIELALISTEGEKAVDVFYLCHQGSKLSKQLKQDLSNRILQAINQ